MRVLNWFRKVLIYVVKMLIKLWVNRQKHADVIKVWTLTRNGNRLTLMVDIKLIAVKLKTKPIFLKITYTNQPE